MYIPYGWPTRMVKICRSSSVFTVQTLYCRVQLKCDGTRWHAGGEVKGKLAEWVASTLHTTAGHGVASITTADTHTLAASSWLNWRPRQFKWTHPFHRKMKSHFCVCAITFQTQSNIMHLLVYSWILTKSDMNTIFFPGRLLVSALCICAGSVGEKFALQPT